MFCRCLSPLVWIVFALTANTSAHAQSTTPAPIPPPALAHHRTLLSITADSQYRQVPDVVRISAGISNQANDAKTALADNSTRMNQMVAAIRAAKVAERDIQTRRINIRPQYRYPRDGEPVFTGYRASNTISLTLRDITHLGDVLDALIANGANEIDGPSFDIDSPETAYDRARMAALDTARQRAQDYAQALGMQVKRIVSVDEGGGFRAIPQERESFTARLAVSDQASTAPMLPGETTLQARLVVVFELED